MIQSVKRNAKNPKMCAKRIIPSANGSDCAKKMLKPTVNTTNRKTISVVCHRVLTEALGFTMRIMSWITTASWMPHEGIPEIHPRQQHQPTIYERLFWNLGGANSLTCQCSGQLDAKDQAVRETLPSGIVLLLVSMS